MNKNKVPFIKRPLAGIKLPPIMHKSAIQMSIDDIQKHDDLEVKNSYNSITIQKVQLNSFLENKPIKIAS